MKINLVPLLMLLGISYGGYAQVGINTTTPKATLDVSVNTTLTNTIPDGVLIPRVTIEDLDNKSGLYGADQNGTLVLVTGGNSTNIKTKNISGPGFYYYDATNSIWKSVSIDYGYGSFTPVYKQIMLNQSGIQDWNSIMQENDSYNYFEVYYPDATSYRNMNFPPANLFKDRTIYIKNNGPAMLTYTDITQYPYLKRLLPLSNVSAQKFYSDGTNWYYMAGKS